MTYAILSPSTFDPEYAASTTQLLHQPQTTSSPSSKRWRVKVFSVIFIATILCISLVLVIINQVQEPHGRTVDDDGDKTRKATPEVLDKVFQEGSGGNDAYPWTNSMLSWERTSYHFQPEKNWMNGRSKIPGSTSQSIILSFTRTNC
ncbi:hypothetical protein LIER_36714 [Lithospermum erythrorhizon]|uniref:Beta-fructofuranosidase n=1 Tax=Lithospermum erythrorhizon TaxID=34254 RepID=A0AAV3PB29_LITER